MKADWHGIADWYAALVRGGSAKHHFSRDILLNALPDGMPGFSPSVWAKSLLPGQPMIGYLDSCPIASFPTD